MKRQFMCCTVLNINMVCDVFDKWNEIPFKTRLYLEIIFYWNDRIDK